MIKLIKAATIVMAGVFVAFGALAAPCAALPNTSVEVDVREAPITMIRDITLSDVRVMSARLPRQPAHTVLGFYAGTVGYAIRSIEVLDAQSCPNFQLDADLVVVNRRIAVANDLAGSPCRLRAAMEHYRHHAAAASLALHRFASNLPATLGPEIEQHIRSQPGTPEELRQYIDSLLDGAVDRFTTSLTQVQEGVDTESEIRRLSAPCDEI
jgi:hypothetical protein